MFSSRSTGARICVLISLGIFVLFPGIASSSPLDVSRLEALVDGVMATHLKDQQIPGATLAIVQNGQLVLAKGYGYADLAKLQPVDPQNTLFRPGSVSKLVVWTAVMQMVEQSKLDLEADVNKYLKKFKIPGTFPEPIRLKHLMTHTPGFEDSEIRLFVPKYSDLDTLEEYLIKQMPARIWAPGIRPAYSNYGTTLAAYLVQVVSGIPFGQYVKENIFEPLGMAQSTFDQEQTAWLVKNLA